MERFPEHIFSVEPAQQHCWKADGTRSCAWALNMTSELAEESENGKSRLLIEKMIQNFSPNSPIMCSYSKLGSRIGPGAEEKHYTF